MSTTTVWLRAPAPPQSGQAQVPHVRDIEMQLPIGTRTRARDVVAAAVQRLPPLAGLPPPDPAAFALFETELPPSMPKSQRRVVRELEPDELPFAVLVGWELRQPADSPSQWAFLVKQRDNPATSSFHRLRMEQCRSLPLEQLQRRLHDINNQETAALDEVRRRHAALRSAIVARLNGRGEAAA
ncbi:hypothetical protein HK105_206645 [Polyrhizophydium stewartii]|uniref:Uncharacterized protein n=1 Tax=Polyrhizophydium stewartii TaxID=2732419 RepID=A0ABR4N2Y3_9FUNG